MHPAGPKNSIQAHKFTQINKKESKAIGMITPIRFQPAFSKVTSSFLMCVIESKQLRKMNRDLCQASCKRASIGSHKEKSKCPLDL